MNKLYQIYAYYLNIHLSKLCDVTHDVYASDILTNIEPSQYDAIILLNKAWGVPNQYKSLAKTKSAIVCSIIESSAHKSVEHILFYMRTSRKRRNRSGCIPITWMCDSTICSPAQSKNEINILIDHDWPAYVKSGCDMTDRITTQAKQFARDYGGDKKIVIKRMYRGGSVCVTIDPYEEGLPEVVVASGRRTKYKDICKIYAAADIFFVTHPESLGMSVLETAMCGCLIVAPKRFIKPHLLNCVKHVDFTVVVPWDTIITTISDDTNITECREMAMKYSWDRAARIIYNTIACFRKYSHRGYELTPKLHKRIFGS